MRRRIVRIDLERPAVAGDRLIEGACILENVAEIVVERRVPGVDLEAPAQHVLSPVASAERAQQTPRVVDRDDVFGTGEQGGLVRRHGGAKSPSSFCTLPRLLSASA